MRRLITMIVAVVLLAQAISVADAAPVIDNERVTVWDVYLTKGSTAPQTPHDMDTVVMFLEGGKIDTVSAHGHQGVEFRRFGDALFIPKGTDARQTMVSSGTAHMVVVALKDLKVDPLVNDSGFPAAFPRPGSVKVLDNGRVVVWNYSWKVGVPTPMHFHDKDVVVASGAHTAMRESPIPCLTTTP